MGLDDAHFPRVASCCRLIRGRTDRPPTASRTGKTKLPATISAKMAFSGRTAILRGGRCPPMPPRRPQSSAGRPGSLSGGGFRKRRIVVASPSFDAAVDAMQAAKVFPSRDRPRETRVCPFARVHARSFASRHASASFDKNGQACPVGRKKSPEASYFAASMGRFLPVGASHEA